jgi:hypothetical protein
MQADQFIRGGKYITREHPTRAADPPTMTGGIRTLLQGFAQQFRLSPPSYSY